MGCLYSKKAFFALAKGSLSFKPLYSWYQDPIAGYAVLSILFSKTPGSLTAHHPFSSSRTPFQIFNVMNNWTYIE